MELSLFKRQWLMISTVGFLFLSACSHVQTRVGSDHRDSAADSVPYPPNPKTLTEVLQQDINFPNSPHSKNGSGNLSQSFALENGEFIVQGMKLKNTRYDIPIALNARVDYWIDYFCGRGRGYFEKYLERSEYFIPFIVPLLKQNGLPEDLVYLAMIESGFNNLARSRARAVGPWQFISATGKRYGLMVNGWIDERRDIRKSTLAAVEYLRDLYNIFQSWELAAAAYNAGEAKIARAVRRFGSKDFWVLSRQRFLRPETRDYVPKIIAAAIISKNRVQFGFPDTRLKPASDEVVAGDGEVVKVVKTEKPIEDKEYRSEKAADLQTELVSDELVSNEIAKSELSDSPDTLDPEEEEVASVELKPTTSTLTPAPLARPVQTPHVTKSGEVGGEELAEFDVKSPADLLKISRAAGLSYQTVKSLNPEILRWCTPPIVATYRIKLPAFIKDRFLATYNHEAFPRKVQFMTYKVRRGETLTRIAQHFGIKVDLMSDLNRMSPRVPLRSGAKVLLPIPNDRSRTFASLDILDPPERRRSHRHRRRFHPLKTSYKHREAARSDRMRQSIRNLEG